MILFECGVDSFHFIHCPLLGELFFHDIVSLGLVVLRIALHRIYSAPAVAKIGRCARGWKQGLIVCFVNEDRECEALVLKW
mmetsp:Transcript_5095/g.5869  ORF Transcript_5095/g.5869 Transcript_5095/m.5869 type:complete len:81 (+) Transcript_5095:302-544(+)